MMKRINILERNQKHSTHEEEGVIYILRANNSQHNNLYKIGKTTNIKKRMAVYNTSAADDMDVLHVQKVSDINAVEKCIKAFAEKYQYRKYKEIYEVDIDFLKKLINECDTVQMNMDQIKYDTPDKYYIHIEHNS
jgi:DNA polymerase elongation subunit (family B)